MNDPASHDRVVRDLVARADRARRGRERIRLFRRLAPLTGVVLALAGVVGYFAGWPVVGILAAMGVIAAGLAAIVLLHARGHDAPDVVAQRVDADAELGGELRSAHWFTAAETRDEWAEFHLDRAAARAATVDVPALYPAESSRGTWLGLAAGAALGLSLAVISPPRPVAAVGETAVAGKDGPKRTAEDLSEELRAKLDALLASISDEKAPPATLKADLEMLKKLMASIDPALQKKLDDLLKQKPLATGADKGKADVDAEELAERNGANGLPEDVKWALEDLAAKLASAKANPQASEGRQGGAGKGEKGQASAQAKQGDTKTGDPSVQMTQESASDPGAAKMMPGGGGMMGGDSSNGAGGNKGSKPGEATPEQIALALRKELIEANQDTAGQNVTKEDLRRKTEQGQSAMGFTRVAATTTFDPSRTGAPPAVPEARQPLLQRYFIRR